MTEPGQESWPASWAPRTSIAGRVPRAARPRICTATSWTSSTAGLRRGRAGPQDSGALHGGDARVPRRAAAARRLRPRRPPPGRHRGGGPRGPAPGRRLRRLSGAWNALVTMSQALRRRTRGATVSFTLELTDEQQALREKAHAFAREVIRPAAAEYDRAQELPWPVLEEAARQGLYDWQLYAELSVDPDRPVAADPHGGAVLGLRRDRAVDRDAGARAGGDPPGGDRRAARALGAGVLRHARRHQARRARRHRAERRQRRALDPDPRAQGRRATGSSTARRCSSATAGSPTCTSSSRPSTPRPATAARACSSCPRARRG